MVSNDANDHADPDESAGASGPDTEPESDSGGVAGVAVEELDQRVVDLLSWILETETRAKIYVHLLANPESTSEEVARGTGLYPSTVREALAELHEETKVTREKRASDGAGNNPYEYTAIKPSELVGGVVDQVQQELNTVFTLDSLLDRDSTTAVDDDVEPVTITVDDESEPVRTTAAGSESASTDEYESDAIDSVEFTDSERTDRDEDSTTEADVNDGSGASGSNGENEPDTDDDGDD